ncbi:uncharacterized protein TrAtP1_006949 [Trichoderma atroviride]|uniref:uncharacterized protein n=1 Tax=Hypocrea atroviridis TaxID=63577 RepID=UPI00331F17C8|nr:hypothetical protein TrAtP1_006949 [Trichoderma atroviride]
MEFILRCEQCNKPFNKKSTFKRHGYYCRSQRGDNTSRRRSCLSCAKSKAGCDAKQPECSRCIAKGLECQYPAKTSRAPVLKAPRSDAASTERQKATDSLVVDSVNLNGDDIILDDALFMPQLGFADLEGNYLHLDDIGTGPNEDLLNPQVNINNSHFSTAQPSPVHRSSPQTDTGVQIDQNLSSPKFSIPTAPGAARSMIRRQRTQTAAQRVSNLISHTLQSYPLMLLRSSTLPPFIHPSMITSNDENLHLESLTNCLSLVQMISTGIQTSRKLFWKNVQMECERLSEEYIKLNKYELLTAMQALLIYVLIRLDEGATDYNNFDTLLLKAVTVTAQRFNGFDDATFHTECAHCNNGLEISWKEWVFRESRRRLGIVYRVVNMLVYFEPMAMCDLPSDLILAPLPAKKQLWEAGDEFVWKAAGQRGMGDKGAFGLATHGGLVKLDDRELSCSDAWLPYKCLETRGQSRSTASWEEWCSGIDGFGGLVMLAASLIA